MSRFVVNKLMQEVNMSAQALAAYRADAPGYVAGFLARQAAAGGDGVSDAERAALDGKDYGALYALGAHPYLLWSFAEAVHVPPMPRPELVESFRQAAIPVGYPDCSTTPLPG